MRPGILTALASLVIAAAPAIRDIHVASPAFAPGGRMPTRFSRAGGDISPPLAWTPVRGAGVYVLIVDDPDAGMAQPFLHWLAWNIPVSVTRLAEGRAPAGAIQGRNDFGGLGYGGPQPPSGIHRYHFRVFALAAPLKLEAGARRADVEAGLRGRVLASGEVVGLFSAGP